MTILDLFKPPRRKEIDLGLEEMFEKGHVVKKRESGEAITENIVDSAISTLPPRYYALLYRVEHDPLLFALVNMYSRLSYWSWPKKFDVVENNEEAQKELDRIVDRTKLYRLWNGVCTRQTITWGGCFIEHLWDSRDEKKRKRIKNFALRTPTKMDFIREEGTNKITIGEPVLNDYGELEGFLWEPNCPEKMVMFKNYTEMSYLGINQPDIGCYGRGLIEPLMTDLVIRKYVEQAIGHSALRLSRPIIDSSFTTIDGNFIKGSKKLADTIAKAWAKFYSNPSTESRYVSRPDFINVDTKWGEPIPSQYVDFLHQSSSLIYTLFGFPGDMGFPNKTNKISDEQMDIFYSNFFGFREEMGLCGFLENILYQNGYDVSVQYKYKPISERHMKEETMRLMRLIKVNAIDPTEPAVRKHLGEEEGIYLAQSVGDVGQRPIK